MNRTLTEAVHRNGGQFAPHLLKYMGEVSISDWGDLTRARVEDLKDAMTEAVAQSSAKIYLSKLKCIVDRYKDEPDIHIPFTDFKEVMRLHTDDTVKTYLSREELSRLEAVQTYNEEERLTKVMFLVGAYTGMRTSDIRPIRLENISGNAIGYVSQKTGVSATVPLKSGITEYITELQRNYATVTRMHRAVMNRAIKRLCLRAGICRKVTVHRGGETKQGEKWKYVTMHTARISFCSNLARLNVPIYDIAKLAGHKNITTTNKYIVTDSVQLSSTAMKYFE